MRERNLAGYGMAAILSAWLAAAATAAPEAPASTPLLIPDESAPRWVVDRFAGNCRSGPLFIQGPARQAGGLGCSSVASADDGSVFLTAGTDNKWAASRIVRVASDGTLRLVAGGGASLADGPAALALIRAEEIRYSASDKSLYFCHRTIPCVRRLFQKEGQWMVETVAGNPDKGGSSDGEARAALLGEPRSLAITSKGVVYVLDGTAALRKIEQGQVSTVVKFAGGPKVIDGPFGTANMSVTTMSGNICLGENDDTLYIADHWHFAARRIDLKGRTITTVVGMPQPPWHPPPKQTELEKRYNNSADGPALTMASFNSGCAWVCWDPLREALWVGGPDELRLRWVKDGALKTVLPFKRGNWRADGLGVPAADVDLKWTHVKDVDRQGGVFVNGASSQTGVWRAYLRKEAGK